MNLPCAARFLSAAITSGVILFAFGPSSGFSDTHYVAPGGSHTHPYTNWATASTTFFAAISAASPGDTVMVSNGVYNTGGTVVYGAMTNRVAINKAILVQSANGPEVTIIEGAKDPLTTNGNAAVRCAYVGYGATLSGFTLRGGATRNTGSQPEEQSGGGVRANSNAAVTNCIITDNSAFYLGGGAYQGLLFDCILSSNTAPRGGGASGATLAEIHLAHCTLSGNSATVYGGGVNNAVFTQGTLTDNTALEGGGGAAYSTIFLSSLSNNTTVSSYPGGGGALASTLSVCTLTGNESSTWGGGAFDCVMTDCTLSSNRAADGGGSVNGTNSACTFSGNIATNEGGGMHGGTASNSLFIGNAAFDGGAARNATLNDCTLSGNTATNAGGGSHGGTLIDCMLSGNTALDGGGAKFGTLTDCTLTGNTASGNGGGSHFSTLNGCTVISNTAYSGGGLYLPAGSNCFIAANTSLDVGGGARAGTLNFCTLSNNTALAGGGGGCFQTTLNHCLVITNTAGGGGGAMYSQASHSTFIGNVANVGGGALYGNLSHCILKWNTAFDGGGAADTTMTNCLLVANHARTKGGACAQNSKAYNCTMTENTAVVAGGGLADSTAFNCIIYYNTAPTHANYTNGVIGTSCITPLTTGGTFGNITAPPLFANPAAGNYRLRIGSPGINAGANGFVTSPIDLSGHPRIQQSTVDMGSYEYQPGGDIDSDGMTDDDELTAGTDLYDAASIWEIASITLMSPATIGFDSVAGRVYAVDRNTDLTTVPQVWTEFTNNVTGTGVPIVITDPVSGPSQNYRVRVSLP